MLTPFAQLMQDLAVAQGDTGKLALITFDFALRDDALLKAAAEAAAVPRWFDEKILAALLPEHAEQADCLLEQLKVLPMVESYPTEDRSPAWSLHEATRNALRRRLWETDLPRFLQLSQRAADYFGAIAGPLEKTREGTEARAPHRIEALCHRLLTQPAEGAYDTWAFVNALLSTHRLERLQAIAALLADLIEGPWSTCVDQLREQVAKEWARAHYNLGLTLYELGMRVAPALGNRLLAQAVCAYRAALKVRTREAMPQKWAGTQNNLGLALSEQGCRSEGQAALDLLRQAVEAYRATLEWRTRETQPQDWAMTQNNLGLALSEQGCRSEGQAALDLLGQAVDAYRPALEVYTREALPQDWAMTQNNLGLALQEQGIRSQGQTAIDLLQRAVEAYRAALEVRNRHDLPQDWAMTQNNLGIALRNQGFRSEGPAALELTRLAVAACRAALEVHDRNDLPQDWAATQNNLGTALSAQGDKTVAPEERRQLYQEAEQTYLLALEVQTPEHLPYDYQQTQDNLTEVRAKLKSLGKS